MELFPCRGFERVFSGLRIDLDDAELHFREAGRHRKAGQPAEAVNPPGGGS